MNTEPLKPIAPLEMQIHAMRRQSRRWALLLFPLMLATALCVCAQIGLWFVRPDQLPIQISADSTADYSPWERLIVAQFDPRLQTAIALDVTRGINPTQALTLIAAAATATAQAPTATASQTPTLTVTATLTQTSIPTITLTTAPEASPTAIPSSTSSPTALPSLTSTPDVTVTPSVTASWTVAPTRTPVASTSTATSTSTPIAVAQVPTPTHTPLPPQADLYADIRLINTTPGTQLQFGAICGNASGIVVTGLGMSLTLNGVNTPVVPPSSLLAGGIVEIPYISPSPVQNITVDVTVFCAAAQPDPNPTNNARALRIVIAPLALPPTPTPIIVPTDTPVVPPTPTDTPVVPPTPTDTPVVPPTPTDTPVVPPTPTDTPVVPPTPTDTPAVPPTPTDTPVVPPTPTDTPAVPPTPTDTPVVPPTPTDTPVVPPTPTDTPVVPPTPTDTPVVPPTPTETPTDTPVAPTATETSTSTPTATPIVMTGDIIREVWLGLNGATALDINALLADPRYPNSPNLCFVETEFNAPQDQAEDYSQRMRALLLPPATGSYVFWITSDNASRLSLSTDENPANAIPIASSSPFNLPFFNFDEFPSQQSISVFLVAGQPYYIEAMHMENIGEDFLRVAWQGPTIPVRETISGTYLTTDGLSCNAVANTPTPTPTETATATPTTTPAGNPSMCTSTTSSAVSGTLYDSGGASSNYGDGENCAFLIQPAGGGTIEMNFSQFNTEASHDLLYVYDGSSTSGVLLGVYSGGALPPTLWAASGSMYLVFTSDASAFDAGFTATWTTAPQGDQYVMCNSLTTSTLTSGTLYDSGGAAYDYEDQENCSFLIQPVGGGTIEMNFSQFNTEASHDLLYVYDGSSASGVLLGVYSGGALPPTLWAASGSMYLVFVSDASAFDAGFTATWTTAPQGDQYVMCNSLTTSTLTSGTLYDSGGAAYDYEDQENCSFLIQPVGGGTIEMNFSQFNTEASHDLLYVYDGSSASGVLLGVYSGGALPPTLWAASGSMYLVFTSDASAFDAGFTATWTTAPQGDQYVMCNSLTTSTLTSGTLYDSGGAAYGYEDQENCSFLIQPAGGGVVQLDFTAFDTENTWDTLTIYDGVDTSGTVLGVYSGGALPPTLWAASGSMHLVFQSDVSIIQAGFAATWSILTPVPGFVRAINFGGTALVVDGNNWEGEASSNYTLGAGDITECPPGTINPPTDINRETMLRCIAWQDADALEITMINLPNGTYDVYFWRWEDNFVETVDHFLQGVLVENDLTIPVTGWRRMGPYSVVVTNGTILFESSGGHQNISGMEVWQVGTGGPGI